MPQERGRKKKKTRWPGRLPGAKLLGTLYDRQFAGTPMGANLYCYSCCVGPPPTKCRYVTGPRLSHRQCSSLLLLLAPLAPVLWCCLSQLSDALYPQPHRCVRAPCFLRLRLFPLLHFLPQTGRYLSSDHFVFPRSWSPTLSFSSPSLPAPVSTVVVFPQHFPRLLRCTHSCAPCYVPFLPSTSMELYCHSGI